MSEFGIQIKREGDIEVIEVVNENNKDLKDVPPFCLPDEPKISDYIKARLDFGIFFRSVRVNGR